MSRILCVAVAMSVLAGPASAGMSEGVAAVTVGDYPKAIAEFQPLASGGDPAAQYQLAKIYLEGHGPADGVPQGVALMTKAATGNHPEAQAQLGLMYAMGLGVPVDNAMAYDWLSKAVKALPEGTRRTVAEANRDAVLKRLNPGQQTSVAAAKPAQNPAPTTSAKPAATQEAKKSAADATAKTAAPKPATTAKTVTEAAATGKPTSTAVAKTATGAAETTGKPASGAKNPEKATSAAGAKTPDKATQVARAKAPEAASGSAARQAGATGVRIQLVSMPSEQAAWDAWKRLSGKYSAQLSGLTATIETADLGTKGTFYRVQTGPFDTVAKAQERCAAMKQAGLDCLVVGRP